jgi:hypothetical protein
MATRAPFAPALTATAVAAPVGLARLLAPMTVAAFGDQHWGRRSCLLRAEDAECIRGLISIADVDRAAAFALSDGGYALLAPGEATGAEGRVPAPRPDLRALARAVALGNALVVYELERRWAPAARLASCLSRDLAHPVSVDLVLAPRAFGGTREASRAQVFMLQVEGESRWAVSAPSSTTRLGPGGVLYVPARTPAVWAAGDAVHTLHLELRVPAFTWKDLLEEALRDGIRQDESLRRAVPSGDADVVAPADRVRAGLVEAVDAGRAREALHRRLSQQRAPLPDGHFRDLERADRVGPATRLYVREGALPYLEVDGETVALRFGACEQRAPRHAAVIEAFHYILDRPRFTVSDLPDGLGEESKVRLCRHLVRRGFLGLAPARAASGEGGAA